MDPDTELRYLAGLLLRRNDVDAEIAALIDRPALPGHLGEWIAARIFDIALHESATHLGSDGVFRAGPLAGREVNVKLYGFQEGLLDVKKSGAPDDYLVLTGPKRSAASSRGGARPIVIAAAYLFSHEELLAEGVRPSVAASVRQHLWTAAMIHPEAGDRARMTLTKAQHEMLRLFAG